VAAVFSFVCRLVDGGEPLRDDRVARLLWVVGRDRGPAVILAGLLLALGERARVECTREIAFVKVALDARDLALAPERLELGRRVEPGLEAEQLECARELVDGTGGGIALEDLVRDARERPPHAVGVHHDRHDGTFVGIG
jgi:hypothetical protein